MGLIVASFMVATLSISPAHGALKKKTYLAAVDLVDRTVDKAFSDHKRATARLYYLGAASAELCGLMALRLDQDGAAAKGAGRTVKRITALGSAAKNMDEQLVAAMIRHFSFLDLLARVAASRLKDKRLEAHRARMQKHITSLMARVKGDTRLKLAALGVCKMADVWAAAVIRPELRDSLRREEEAVRRLVLDIDRRRRSSFLAAALWSAYRFVRLAGLSLDQSLGPLLKRLDNERYVKRSGRRLPGTVRAYLWVYRATYIIARGLAGE